MTRTTLSKACSLLLSALLMASAAPAFADRELDELRGPGLGSEWRLIKNDSRKKIKAWDKRDDDKKYRSFKLDLIVDAPLEAVARAYFDIEYYHRWFWEVQEGKILKKVSDTEFYYYVVHRAPVGLPPRDVIIHATIEPYTAKKGYALFKLEAKPDFIPPRAGHVRMQAEDMVIKWTPQPDGTTREEVEGYIDPGGHVPAWAINAVQRQAPYYTVMGLQRVVQTDRFKNPKEPMPFRVRD
jgi:hypothetical protein